MIRLTQYDDRGDFWIDPSKIIAVTNCQPLQGALGNEHGRRTRIDYEDGGSALVTETPAEIAALAGWQQEERA